MMGQDARVIEQIESIDHMLAQGRPLITEIRNSNLEKILWIIYNYVRTQSYLSHVTKKKVTCRLVIVCRRSNPSGNYH